MKKAKKIISILILSLTVSASAGTYPIAGVNPEKRPEGAPIVTTVAKDKPSKYSAVWYKLALHGIDAPYPKSLLFLGSQGNWYNPFIYPGMVDNYDIRGFHN